jgi:hypothetical protein
MGIHPGGGMRMKIRLVEQRQVICMVIKTVDQDHTRLRFSEMRGGGLR